MNTIYCIVSNYLVLIAMLNLAKFTEFKSEFKVKCFRENIFSDLKIKLKHIVLNFVLKHNLKINGM